jgi:excisionase family DNA binding protein
LPTEWLSLSKAAQLLGVHPGTVRNWSDQGVLPVHRTKGGHRRYRREEIELWMQSQRTTGQNGLDLMVQTALRNTRFKISEGSLNEEAWYNKLDNEAREQYRHSGRAMVQGLIGYIGSNGNIAESEARALGYEYASRARRYNLSMVEATNAFLFFRNVLVESMLAVYEAASVRSPNAWSGLLRKVNAFTDKILTTLLESYEAYPRNNR